MSADLAKIRTLLPRLSPDELKQVRALLGLLDKTPSAPKECEGVSQETAEVVFYGEFSHVLLTEGLTSPPFTVFRKSRSYPKFKEGREAIDNFLNKATKPKRLTRSQRKKIHRIMMKFVISWMRKCGVPLTSQAVSNNLIKAPMLLSQEFPGYVESGLLMTLADTL